MALDRRLSTVVFTDIVGSTEKASKLGDHRWKALLDRHHATVRSLLTRYRGTEIRRPAMASWLPSTAPLVSRTARSLAQLSASAADGDHVAERFAAGGPAALTRCGPAAAASPRSRPPRSRRSWRPRPRPCPPARHTGAAARWPRPGREPGHGAAHLGRPRPAAAPHAGLQALQRPALRREAQRHRRALPEPAREGARAVRRREEPDPGARPHPAEPADEEGPRRHHDPRLQAQRHDDPVRRARARSTAASSASACRATATRSSSAFLRTLDREFPRGLELHLILDNYPTHKHANVAAWLEKHPRFHLHFTPTTAPG